MQALLVIDAQNEFSPEGLRPVPNHGAALEAIRARVRQARQKQRPIAWIQHHNKPEESPAFVPGAFVPGSWGAQLSPGLGVQTGYGEEQLFKKDVYGAFSGTGLEDWLRSVGATRLLLVGFYTHMCLSTSAREALIRGFDVEIDAEATGARELTNEILGHQTAGEVCRSALLHLNNMGARIVRVETAAETRQEISVGS